jgi:conjugal transfer pilin signal peptidase TrbI
MIDYIYLHLLRRGMVYLMSFVAFVTFGRYFTLTINVSDSLPGTLFLVQKEAKPRKGDLAAFRYGGGGPYEMGALFLKQTLGVSGSEVLARDIGMGYREYFVDGQSAGRAKPISKGGLVLQHGPVGIIPDGHFFMSAPHPDSLDSRYAFVGWVSETELVGRAISLF